MRMKDTYEFHKAKEGSTQIQNANLRMPDPLRANHMFLRVEVQQMIDAWKGNRKA